MSECILSTPPILHTNDDLDRLRKSLCQSNCESDDYSWDLNSVQSIPDQDPDQDPDQEPDHENATNPMDDSKNDRVEQYKRQARTGAKFDKQRRERHLLEMMYRDSERITSFLEQNGVNTSNNSKKHKNRENREKHKNNKNNKNNKNKSPYSDFPVA
jgi:hypothetical protein